MRFSARTGLEWRRGSKCDNGQCVEIAKLDAVIMIRDSAEPGNASLTVSRDVWQDFVSMVQAGVFDAL